MLKAIETVYKGYREYEGYDLEVNAENLAKSARFEHGENGGLHAAPAY